MISPGLDLPGIGYVIYPEGLVVKPDPEFRPSRELMAGQSTNFPRPSGEYPVTKAPAAVPRSPPRRAASASIGIDLGDVRSLPGARAPTQHASPGPGGFSE